MQETTVITASESEIVNLIRTHLPKYTAYDSIVAEEEIGNHHWNCRVDTTQDFTVLEGLDCKWRTSDLLDILCTLGHISAGDYVIDCTW